MDITSMLLDQIYSWFELQNKCAEKLDKLSTELADKKQITNVTKVVGSSVSVGGAVAVTTAGILTFLTGGTAIPGLAAAGGIASWVGLATNMGSEVGDFILSTCTMKEAEKIAEEIQSVEKTIQKLMETLADEAKTSDVPSEDYVVEQLLRAMAKRNGLELNQNISLTRTVISKMDIPLNMFKETVCFLIQQTLEKKLGEKILVKTSKKAGKVISKRASTMTSSALAPKVAEKAARRVAGRTVGLLFSLPELINNCKNLDNCETEVTQSLRDKAQAIRSAAEEFKKNLDEIQKVIQQLATVERFN